MSERLTINRQFHVATKRSGTKQIQRGAKLLPQLVGYHESAVCSLWLIIALGWFKVERSSINPN